MKRNSSIRIHSANYHIRFLLPAPFVENANLNYPDWTLSSISIHWSRYILTVEKKDKTGCSFLSDFSPSLRQFRNGSRKAGIAKTFFFNVPWNSIVFSSVELFPGWNWYTFCDFYVTCYECGKVLEKVSDISFCASSFVNLNDQWSYYSTVSRHIQLCCF